MGIIIRNMRKKITRAEVMREIRNLGTGGGGPVTTERIEDAAVTNEKIADGAVAEDKIVDGAVSSSKLAGASVSTNKIAPYAVTSDKLSDRSVTNSKIADGAVTAEKLDASGIAAIESGSWTPTLSDAKATATAAKYTKIGNMVILTCQISTLYLEASTTIRISGLPFSVNTQLINCIVGFSTLLMGTTEGIAVKVSTPTQLVSMDVLNKNSYPYYLYCIYTV